MVKIGIHGFGRLGRQLLKVAINSCKQQNAAGIPKLVMVNDPGLNPECIGYLLERDSFYGRCGMDITQVGSALMIDGQRVEFTRESTLDKIPWKDNKVDIVIDTTGHNTSCEKASMFLTEGIKRVITTGCSKIPMFVVGVNHCCFDLQMKVVSAANPQLNCLICLLRVLHENFQVLSASSCVIEPLSSNCKLLDDTIQDSNCKYSRSAWVNFFSSEPSCNSAFVEKIMPELEGKSVSTSVKVPVACAGAIDLTVKLGKEASYEALISKVKQASDTYMKGLIKCTNLPVVSGDLIGDSHSCVVDTNAGLSLSKCMVKLFAWYDAEWSFANRVYDLAKYVASREGCKETK